MTKAPMDIIGTDQLSVIPRKISPEWMREGIRKEPQSIT